jgi:hypothetical protein
MHRRKECIHVIFLINNSLFLIYEQFSQKFQYNHLSSTEFKH